MFTLSMPISHHAVTIVDRLSVGKWCFQMSHITCSRNVYPMKYVSETLNIVEFAC